MYYELENVRVEVGLHTIKYYVRVCRSTIIEFLVVQPIHNLAQDLRWKSVPRRASIGVSSQ